VITKVSKFIWKGIYGGRHLNDENACDFSLYINKVALSVASCGIAALLLQGGINTHSMFHIPQILIKESKCDIGQCTHLAKLLKNTSLILWYEAPVANKIWF
jgi:hypothetical protein